MMTVLEVAAGVVAGWLVLCALLLAVVVILGRGSALLRGSCRVCGGRGSRVDVLDHEEENHHADV